MDVNFPKSASPDIAVDAGEVCVVESVEHFGADLQGDSFRKRQPLGEAQVDVLDAGQAEGISPQRPGREVAPLVWITGTLPNAAGLRYNNVAAEFDR